MVKETPSLGRIMAMVAFAMSCFGILLFLWLAFGGSVPLRAQGYRFTASFPEAATLAQEADVRMAGVNIGKVKTKELDKRGARTKVEIEIKPQYAPIPADTKAILRQKTLLGETYVELAAGTRGTKKLADGGHLSNQRIEPTVELDEIFNSFDKPTRQAFQEWVAELSKSIKGGRGEDLNDAFGNLEGFATDGSTLTKTLDEQEIAVRRLIKNTGVVFGAINERDGALRQLITNSNNTFEATASRDQALADTFRVFPTFLDESKATLARLEKFSNNTRPLVNALKPSADDLGPTVRDLGNLAPNLEALFRDLPPLINASKTGVPDLAKFLKGAEPFFEATHAFFPQFNPILSEFNFYQSTIAGFITNGSADLAGDFGGQRYQTQLGIIEPRSFLGFPVKTRPATERGQTYLAPNALTRGISLGGFESFDCKPSGGEKHDAVDTGSLKAPPCFVSPPSLYNGKSFIKPGKGQAPLKRAPVGNEGSKPADPDQR